VTKPTIDPDGKGPSDFGHQEVPGQTTSPVGKGGEFSAFSIYAVCNGLT